MRAGVQIVINTGKRCREKTSVHPSQICPGSYSSNPGVLGAQERLEGPCGVCSKQEALMFVFHTGKNSQLGLRRPRGSTCV